MNTRPQLPRTDSVEGIDFDKLRMVVTKNLWVIILIFVSTNLAMYLTLRWTKEVYESHSELKLDVKQDATALGITQIVEDQNMNLIAGEIEQMTSKLFFDRVVDSLDLWVSYYYIGNVLEHEMYRNSPFIVTYSFEDDRYKDQPIYFDFVQGGRYTIRVGSSDELKEAALGEYISLEGGKLEAHLAPGREPEYDAHFFFEIHTRERLTDFLAQNLSVEPINPDAHTIRVSLQHHNPLKAYTIVNKVDSIYLDYSNEQKNMANRQKILWLNNELAQVEVKMENFENYFEDFTIKNKSSDLSSDLGKTIISINRLDSQRYDLAKRISELNIVIDDLAANRATSTFMPKPYLPQYINARIEDYLKMLQDGNKLKLSYKDNTFAYKQKEQEASVLKTSLFNQLNELKKGWLASMAELNQRKDKLEKKFAGMPDKNTQYAKNQRFYKLYEEFYLSMMQSKAEFEIAQAGSTPDFKILSSANFPGAPIAPRRYMYLGIGLVAGIALNFFFIGLVYIVNNKITGLQEVERSTHVPVLGVVPQMRAKFSGPFYIAENPKSVVSEAIRTLRTNLDFFASSSSKKVIAISSTVSGEGKSFLAMNLGGVLAMSKKRVILLDLDMRKAKDYSHATEVDQTRGVSTILINRNTLDECIAHTSLEGFDFIPSGPHPPNPSELLLNGEFEGMINELRTRYDYVVIDTPPVGLVTDGIMAMKRADLSIYVVRANYSKRDFLRNIDRIVSINKLSHVAIVLNALPSSGKTYGYGYYKEDQKTSWLNQILGK